MLRLFISDFEDMNKKQQMKLFGYKEIFDQTVVEIIGRVGVATLQNIVRRIYLVVVRL